MFLFNQSMPFVQSLVTSNSKNLSKFHCHKKILRRRVKLIRWVPALQRNTVVCELSKSGYTTLHSADGQKLDSSFSLGVDAGGWLTN